MAQPDRVPTHAHGTHNVMMMTVPHVEYLLWRQVQFLAGDMENFGIGFLGTHLAGNDQMFKIVSSAPSGDANVRPSLKGE
jgi:hypothetical protein